MTNNVRYNPNASCGSSPVYIANQATAGLYNYTPYQPNAAALAAGAGSGDYCSAYGNRNFWIYFTNWFGSTQTAGAGDLADLYVSTGAENGPLGAVTQGVTCGLLNGGCKQGYANGSIYWSPATGAQVDAWGRSAACGWRPAPSRGRWVTRRRACAGRRRRRLSARVRARHRSTGRRPPGAHGGSWGRSVALWRGGRRRARVRWVTRRRASRGGTPPSAGSRTFQHGAIYWSPATGAARCPARSRPEGGRRGDGVARVIRRRACRPPRTARGQYARFQRGPSTGRRPRVPGRCVGGIGGLWIGRGCRGGVAGLSADLRRRSTADGAGFSAAVRARVDLLDRRPPAREALSGPIETFWKAPAPRRGRWATRPTSVRPARTARASTRGSSTGRSTGRRPRVSTR